MLTQSLIPEILPLLTFPWLSLDINHFYVVHETGKGLLSYARGRPTKDRTSQTDHNSIPCTSEMITRICELRNDFLLHDNTRMLLFVSIATDDMVRMVSMYPEVWFLDCTYGESKPFSSINNTMFTLVFFIHHCFGILRD